MNDESRVQKIADAFYWIEKSVGGKITRISIDNCIGDISKDERPKSLTAEIFICDSCADSVGVSVKSHAIFDHVKELLENVSAYPSAMEADHNFDCDEWSQKAIALLNAAGVEVNRQ